MSLVIAWAYFHKLYEEGSQPYRELPLFTQTLLYLSVSKNDFERQQDIFLGPCLCLPTAIWVRTGR